MGARFGNTDCFPRGLCRRVWNAVCCNGGRRCRFVGLAPVNRGNYISPGFLHPREVRDSPSGGTSREEYMKELKFLLIQEGDSLLS